MVHNVLPMHTHQKKPRLGLFLHCTIQLLSCLSGFFLRRKIWQCQATQKREAIMFNFSPFDLELHVASYVLLLLIWPAHCLHGCNATTLLPPVGLGVLYV